MLKSIGITIVGFIVVSIIWMAIGGISGTVSYENKPEVDNYKLEMEIVKLTNEQRSVVTKESLGPHDIANFILPLTYDPKLSEIARNHSKEMANTGVLTHTSLNGNDPSDRGFEEGYRCYKEFDTYYTEGIAENIFQNNLYDSYTTLNGVTSSYEWNTMEEIAQSTVQGWMESGGHRDNILDKTYDRIGVGVVISENDEVYITQNFC